MRRTLCNLAIAFEQDVVSARQRARDVARAAGFDVQDQARIATAVSEIARNALRYAGGGAAEFAVEAERTTQALVVRISDRGGGIPHLADVLGGRYVSSTGMGLGLLGAQRLVDRCEVRSGPDGTEVTLKKDLPAAVPVLNERDVRRIVQACAAAGQGTALQELQQQHRELLAAYAELRERKDELARLNRELEDTNRGVVALYAELDEKADHLRRADASKTRFLSNMSHEFRTPLNSIRALSGLLLDRVDGDLSSEQERQVGYIRKAADDLAQIVEDLLDIAKIESGHVEVHAEALHVPNLFSALRGMLKPLLVAESVSLHFEDTAGLPTLHTDEAKLSQILRNFISNALKFTPRGEVRVRAQREGGQAIRFEVADTGIGIALEHQAVIFEEFVQVPGPLQRQVRGTGLGLPLCRRLAALLGGSVAVDSTPALGSTFAVTIPLHFAGAADGALPPVTTATAVREAWPAAAPTAMDEAVAPSAATMVREAATVDAASRPREAVPIDAASNLREAVPIDAASNLREAVPIDAASRPREAAPLAARVLVVDDDAGTRYTLRRLLNEADVQVLEAHDGAAALRMARAAHPALIVLDLGLPDVDGVQILATLKADAATCSIPVVIATSRALSDDDRRGLNRYAEAILHKSELGEVLVAVTAALNRALVPAHPTP
jgi:signal transduction histidine kinase